MTTEDGGLVLPGTTAFKLVDTHGIPLAILLFVAHERGLRIDWFNFIGMAMFRGWNVRSLRSKVLEALTETYGPNPEFPGKVDLCIRAHKSWIGSYVNQAS
jgi:hypothetical protein